MLTQSQRNWVLANWFLCGACAAGFLFALLPILYKYLPLPLWVVLLQLPLYMVHQVEEHFDDRFRISTNRMLGVDALSRRAVLVINLAGVWLYDLFALYLAFLFTSAAGLMAMYLSIVNALMHLVSGVVRRKYNPGLVTAAVLLLPGGLYGCHALNHLSGATLGQHVAGGLVAVLLHAVLLAFVFRRRAQLLRSA